MEVQNFTVYDAIERNARVYPNADCIVFQDRRLTHAAFKSRCDRLAAGLERAGVVPGDRLAVLAQNSDSFMILYGAAAKIGAVVLPVNWRFQRDEIEYVLGDGSPKLVFAGPDYQDTVGEIAGTLDSVKACYTMGDQGPPEGFHAFEDLYTDQGADARFHVPADSGFVIIHTAAVEGRPRGALLSHRNLVCSDFILMYDHGLGPMDAHACVVPLFHIAGLALSLAVLHAGGKNVILERFDADRAVALMQEERCTTFFDFAPILSNLLDAYDRGSYDLSSIRNVLGLDSAETIGRFEKTLPNATFWCMFGQTESLHVSMAPFREKPGSAGRPCPLSQVVLFDDYDNEVPMGTPGEICVRSPNVFLGYWGLEEETAYTFRNGWHHTGDMGRFDEDGYLWYGKRKAQKELIKPGGENVYPSEVEKTVLECGAVAEVSVIGVPDPRWGEAVKAVCVLKPGKTLDPQELTDFVGSRIARYKKPKYVVFVDALPKTEDGQIDREQVKKEHGSTY